ncbi:unnamed protein product [Closterium sp. NIES-64]|nr:unnamed protein product [Closterium sp. NIES-64]
MSLPSDTRGTATAANGGSDGSEMAVGFVGLGAMGGGMAAALVKRGFAVKGFDVYPPACEKLKSAGGAAAASAADAAKGAVVLVLMVTTAKQAEGALFGDEGALQALPPGAVVILCSTVPPEFARSLGTKLSEFATPLHSVPCRLSVRAAQGKGWEMVDAPVSGGVARAADGTLTIMAAATPAALAKARPVLEAMSAKLYIVGDTPGAGSAVKMVNQLLAGVHIAAAAEAMALGARAGLNARMVFDIISHAAGNSWMFENRVPHMLDNDYTPRSALNIFVKDLGIVLGEAQSLAFPLPLAAAAHQQFLAGAAAGLGREDDAAVVKPTVQSKAAMLAALPPEWTGSLEVTRGGAEGKEGGQGEAVLPVVVVLDDDPTGTQTVHGLHVLTTWDVETLKAEMAALAHTPNAAFFILTNSRALPTQQAAALTHTICSNVVTAAQQAGILSSSGGKDPGCRGITLILRGDSTLRGHFPQEVEAAEAALGTAVDAWVVCPFFLEGGRYTINDVHYVADGSDRLVPAAQTEFAKDAAFGYSRSNLKQWVEEKTGGARSAADVASISIETIRGGGSSAVLKALMALPKGSVCILNAASDSDLHVATAALRHAEAAGRSFLVRSAASFVSSLLSLPKLPPLGPPEWAQLLLGGGADGDCGGEGEWGRKLKRWGWLRSGVGGLIVVGSYVPKTSAQISAADVASDSWQGERREAAVAGMAGEAERALREGSDVVIMTSRELITGSDAASSLEIGSRVSEAVVDVVKAISVRPKYILAKGGITSSDVATKALGVRRARVEGQAMAGVPLWRLDGASTFPDLPYIVFPGNVGSSSSLADVVQRWRQPITPPLLTMLDLVRAAAEGGYAVGAFNVYNLEGVRAVVKGAEEERSPAIIQLHPSAICHGGEPLMAACKSAAMAARVPIALHLDHATDVGLIQRCVEQGWCRSIMADGSHLPLADNIAFTQRVVAALAALTTPAAVDAPGPPRAVGGGGGAVVVEAEVGRIAGVEDGETVEDIAVVEAEVGRIAGVEDGETVEEIAGRLTQVEQVSPILPLPIPCPILPLPIPCPILPLPIPCPILPLPIPSPILPLPIPSPILPLPIPSPILPLPIPSPILPLPIPCPILPLPIPCPILPLPIPCPILPLPIPCPILPLPIPCPILPLPIPSPILPLPIPSPILPLPIPSPILPLSFHTQPKSSRCSLLCPCRPRLPLNASPRCLSSQCAETFLQSVPQVSLLAVCVGNRHGPYPPSLLSTPASILNLPLLCSLAATAAHHHAHLVLHGASGLPPEIVQECVQCGVRKFNVNTELRAAYMEALGGGGRDLVDVMGEAERRMIDVVRGKLKVFGSAGRV